MEVMLVRSHGVELIHGTENGKKTGCGINLVKEGRRYEQIGAMRDICEISCDKCKYVIAQKMIKADKKERTRMMKEEKMRAKMGLADEGIVPLGNTQAKITKAPKQQKPEKPAAPVQPESAPAAEAPVQPAPKTIPGTGIAFDNDLAQFAINVPQAQEEPVPAQPAPRTIPGTGIPIDDDLAQFAINAPKSEPEETQQKNVPVQDEFLAQFAIPSPAGQPVPEAPAAETAPSNEYAAAPAEGTAEPEELSDDDLVKMFSVSSDGNSEESRYVNDENVIDVNEDELTAVTDEPEEIPLTEDSMSQWESVANQLFGSEPETEQDVPAAEEAAPDYMSDLSVPEAPAAEEAAPDYMSDLSVPETPAAEEAAPDYMSDLSVPETPAAEEAAPDYMSDLSVPEAPAAEEAASDYMSDLSVPETPAAEEAAPDYMSDLSVPEAPAAEVTAPDYMSDLSVPEVQTAPENEAKPEEINSEKYTYTSPVFPDDKPAAPAQPANAPAPAAETSPIVSVPQFSGFDRNGQPIYSYVQARIVGYDMNGQPVLAPVHSSGTVQQNPTQPMNVFPQSNIPPVMSAPQPAAPVMSAPQPAAPAMSAPQPAAPVMSAPQPAAPVMNAPQTAAPIMNAPQPAAPVMNTPQPAAPAMSAPQPAAPVMNAPQPAAPAMSSAPQVNISKIADGRNKPIPKAFVNAIASSREKSQQTIFDRQGVQMPTLDSIDDVLSTINDTPANRRKKEENKAVPVFEEYSAPSKTSSGNSSVTKKQQPASARPLTKAELKAQKKQEKIDQKFKKSLSKRGF